MTVQTLTLGLEGYLPAACRLTSIDCSKLGLIQTQQHESSLADTLAQQ